jgi:hypothetical protein
MAASEQMPSAMAPQWRPAGLTVSRNLINTAINGHLPDGMVLTPAPSRSVQDPVHLWHIGQYPNLPAADKQRLEALLLKRKGDFAYSLQDFNGGYNGIAGSAFFQPLDPSKHTFARPRAYSPLQKDIVDKKFKELVEAGLIEPAPHSLDASRITVAAQKAPDGTWTQHRMCGDYRNRNELNAGQHTRTAVADELFREIGGSRYYSKLDLKSGFLQIPVHDTCKDQTSLWFGRDLYRYKYLPFGFKQAPSIFQRDGHGAATFTALHKSIHRRHPHS